MTVCLITAGILEITELTKLKAYTSRDLSYRTYFDCADDYDVLFLGTSHVMFGVNPLEIWNEFGITSYNWGSPTCTLPMIYWKLKCILETSKPKLVVVDCLRASWSEKAYNNERMHQAFDAFDLSWTKVLAIEDLMDNWDLYSRQDRLNMLSPLASYHTRWDDIQKIDFENSYVNTKGCEFEARVGKPVEISHTTESLEVTYEMFGVDYLKKIISLCRENDIQLLLTYLPYPTSSYWKRESNMIQDVADEYGADYLNFTDIDCVDYDVDFADSDSHMNAAGQKKMSHVLGEYIRGHYEGIPDRREDEALAAEWNILYSEQIAERVELLKSSEKMNVYLMLAYGLPVELVLDVRDSRVFRDEVIVKLLGQLGVNTDELSEDTKLIIIRQSGSLSLSETELGEQSLQTESGELRISGDGKEYTIILSDGEYSISTKGKYDMKISAYLDGELIDGVCFDYALDENGEAVQTSFNRIDA